MPCAHDQIELTTQPNNYRLIMAASLGNGLEIFDFTVYSFFAMVIGKLYFPSDTAYGSLLMAVAVFGVGFVMRPLGSVLLGGYADRQGRKAAMLVTIMLMGIGTALIAFAPTHEQIGWLAPVLIVIGRLLQGFAAGGRSGQRPRCCWSPPAPISADSLLAGSLSAKGLPPCLALH